MANEEVKYTLSLKDLFTGKMREADASVNKFESSMGRAQSAANSLAGAVGIAFGSAAVVAFGAKMIQAGTTVENALTGLTTLLKDKAEAQQVINSTMEDATKTPFAFEGLLAANKALISAGVGAKAAREDVLNLANAIAATGGGDDELQRMVVNLQQIRNTGKATALDIKQFAYAGVNVYKVLAEATGKPIEKVKDMEVSYDMLTYALKKAHDQGGIYASGLENMQKNTSVQISNLGDSVFQLSVRMFNDLKPAIDSIISGLGSMVQVLSGAWEWAKRNALVFKTLGVAIGIAAAAYGVYRGVLMVGMAVQATQTAITYIQIAAMYQLGTAYEGATIGTRLLAAAQWALNAAMTANPIGVIIVALAAVGAAIYAAYQKFGWFRAGLWATWAVIKEFAGIVTDVFMGLGKVISGVLTFNPKMVADGATQTINAVRDTAERIGKAAKDGYAAGMADFNAQNKTVAAPKAAAVAGKKNGAAGVPEMKAETKGAQGQKNVNITVHIGSLVKELKISTTNITEGAGKIREMVSQALISATNDSQLIAGQ